MACGKRISVLSKLSLHSVTTSFLTPSSLHLCSTTKDLTDVKDLCVLVYKIFERNLALHLCRSSCLGLLHISVSIMYHLTTAGLDLHNLSFLIHIGMPSTLQLQILYCPTNALNYMNYRIVKNTLKM